MPPTYPVATSPMTQAAFADFGGAMGNSVMRFWAVEHIFGMLVASLLMLLVSVLVLALLRERWLGQVVP